MHQRTGRIQSLSNLIPVNSSKKNDKLQSPSLIFLELHHKETRKLMAAHITRYNKELECQFPKETKTVIRNVKMKKTGELRKTEITVTQNSPEYSKLAIKAPGENVLYALLDMYAAFLKRNAHYKIANGVFKTNNQALCTKLNGRISRVSVWRHLNRLIQAGVLKNKKFNGTNTSYSIEFNPALLVADINNDYTNLLLLTASKKDPQNNLQPEQKANIYSERPSFSQFPGGWLSPTNVSICSHTVCWNSTQELNINYECGVPSEHQMPADGAAEKKLEQGRDRQFSGQKIPPELDLAVTACWNIALAIFPVWAEKFRRGIYSQRQILEAKSFIHYHLRQSLSNGHSNQRFINGFGLVLNNQARALVVLKNSFMPRPELFFDPGFKCDDGSPAGFLRAKQKYLAFASKWKRRNLEFNKRMKLTFFLYHRFSTNPTAENFRTATQQLGKLSDCKYLDLFNSCVLNERGISQDELQSIWRKEMQK